MEWFNAELVGLLLFFVGLSGLMLRRNMMISIVSMGVMDSGIILFFLTMNRDVGAHLVDPAYYMEVDTVPHALMLTSIVIGVAVTAIGLIMILDFYNKYKTLDWDEAKKIRDGQGIA
ncbi:MAG: cation:proton antiporter subunit C [Turicibacter sp.]|nr:cation:proton antiporter subunit C [Turicibacter sp.]